MSRKVILAWACCCLGLVVAAQGEVIRVPGDYPTIQAGIDAAQNGDTVLVADGVYTGDGNRDLDFGGKLISVVSENGPEDCIIDCEGSENDPHRGFYFHSGETSDAVLAGFTIKNGYVTEDSPGGGHGGAILCDSSHPTIKSCTFRENWASRGGGILCESSSPTIKNCTFRENWAGYDGSGMCNVRSSPTVINCAFSGNSTEYNGGGMTNYDDSNPTVINCTFSGNSAGGGGGMSNYVSNPTLTDCAFTQNTASVGAGMWNHGERPTLTNCTFSGNVATETGGGMYNFNSGPVVTNCAFRENEAYEGGGMYNRYSCATVRNCVFRENTTGERGGGIYCDHSTLTITNCTITRNGADGNGGGVCCCNRSTPTITNCSITENTAEIYGGGIYCNRSTPTITNCTIRRNSATNGRAVACDSSQQQYPSEVEIANSILWDGGDEIWNNDGSTIRIIFSDVEGGWPGRRNIDADPLFVGGPLGDYYLSQRGCGQPEDSPCIDAGKGRANKLGLRKYTTCTEGKKDKKRVDMGFHYPR